MKISSTALLVGWLLGSVVLSIIALKNGDNQALHVEGYKVAFGLVAYGVYEFFSRRSK